MLESTDSLQTVTSEDILKKARAIGYQIWEDRVRAWRRSQRQKIDHLWLQSVRRSYEYGTYDNEDGVQAALLGIAFGVTLKDNPSAEFTIKEIPEDELCPTLLQRLRKKLFGR